MERPDHILIVDDDAEIRTLLARYLEKNGLRATTAAQPPAEGLLTAVRAELAPLVRRIEALENRLS